VGNIIIDHCSASWGNDQTLDTYRHMYDPTNGGPTLKLPCVNDTIQWCIITEALNLNNHGFGGDWGGRNTGFHHNLFACNTGRNPSIAMSYDFNFVNNVLFNWKHRSLDGGDKNSLLNIINNYYKPGPATLDNPVRYRIVEPAASANFLYAGRLVYWKGPHLALKALAGLRKHLPNATLTIIGTGSSEKRLKQLSAKLGLQNSVRWLGWIPHEEMWAQYCRYTAFVFPSLHDSSGNVLLEALSQALPVICLDTGGPGTIIPPSCGIKVPVKNRCEGAVVKDLSAAMQRLANNPELRAQMGCRALDFASANTWKDVVSSAYAQIHDSVHTFGTHTVLNTDRPDTVAGVDHSAP